MPAWIHDRADHIRSKNPDMSKSESFAIATQQAHKLGKTPKGYGTSAGKKKAKMKYDKPKKEYRKTASIFDGFFKGAMEDPLDNLSPVENALLRDGMGIGSVVGGGLGMRAPHRGPKERLFNTLAGAATGTAVGAVPAVAYVTAKRLGDGVKQANAIPTDAENNFQREARKKLQKAQKVGTPDDPNMGIKPLNAFKPPKVKDSASSVKSSSSISGLGGFKGASVSRQFFAKMAMDMPLSPYSAQVGYGSFRQTSGLVPVGSGVSPASRMDPKLGGDAPYEEEEGDDTEKRAVSGFSSSGFGHADSHGAWMGNGGRDASGLSWRDPGPASRMDPKLSGESTEEDLDKFKRALVKK